MKNDILIKFKKWLYDNNCIIEHNTESKIRGYIEILELDSNNNPFWTLGYHTFKPNMTADEQFAEFLNHLCDKTLLINNFNRLGLTDVSSFEELELKIAILGSRK